MDAIFSMPLVVTVTLIRYPNQKAEKIFIICNFLFATTTKNTINVNII